MREDKVDKRDGDGREVLQEQTGQPVVTLLRDKVSHMKIYSPNPGHAVPKPDDQHQRLTPSCDFFVAK